MLPKKGPPKGLIIVLKILIFNSDKRRKTERDLHSFKFIHMLESYIPNSAKRHGNYSLSTAIIKI
jgi:hypothetical protein